MMNQQWFEMIDVRRRRLMASVWTPLRAINRIQEVGRFGHAGYRSEFYGVGTIAVPIASRADAERLGWTDVGISHTHRGGVESGQYIPADVYKDFRGRFTAVHLVLEQEGTGAEPAEWHLHQDFVVTLGLRREGDVWVRPDEGYVEIARLSRRESGAPRVLEVRASHLRDYLCARGMGLYATSYRQRIEIVDDAGHISWPNNPLVEEDGTDRWQGSVAEIHEGGRPFGARTAVFHVARTDVDPAEDVPVLGEPSDDVIESRSWTTTARGKKLYQVRGELWRNEWVDPLPNSPIVRGDQVAPTAFFITDAAGTQESRATLTDGGRWLWFRPDVVPALAHRRGGRLAWYTRDTGSVECSPGYGVHFGVNPLGLVTVYAKDIALLPEWQQRIWAGFNVAPEGGVSEELLASQVRADPAETQAPEAFLRSALEALAEAGRKAFGIELIRPHEHHDELLDRAHRFRAVDRAGLLALAKDLARLTADSINAGELHKVVAPPKGERWGSLKSLEKLLGTRIDPAAARELVAPLVGAYELRHADAHLPGSKVKEALALAGIDESVPPVVQGYQLLDACVSSIYAISKVLKA